MASFFEQPAATFDVEFAVGGWGMRNGSFQVSEDKETREGVKNRSHNPSD
jgi:hypothetical protein